MSQVKIFYLKGSQEKDNSKKFVTAFSASVKNLASETMLTELKTKYTDIHSMTTLITEELKDRRKTF